MSWGRTSSGLRRHPGPQLRLPGRETKPRGGGHSADGAQGAAPRGREETRQQKQDGAAAVAEITDKDLKILDPPPAGVVIALRRAGDLPPFEEKIQSAWR
ncbi:hypothetical protein NDU88_006106 [Pleurodeles waltl]|uniref:Uncharacterized protein n=1 Tax=Pleurodeles waltl TaxID=8319 RepID=A0AAV7VNP0_PLEWA|nr:hypothetical protein NDU88_006106 [Pleurodeles waltl]